MDGQRAVCMRREQRLTLESPVSSFRVECVDERDGQEVDRAEDVERVLSNSAEHDGVQHHKPAVA